MWKGKETKAREKISATAASAEKKKTDKTVDHISEFSKAGSNGIKEMV